MPNGMKLMMLTVQCQPDFDERIDVAFYNLIENLHDRLKYDKVIKNLAHPDQPELTKTSNDSNVSDFYEKLEEALEKLSVLFDDTCTKSDARTAWNFIFQHSAKLKEIDDELAEKAKKEAALMQKASLIGSSMACTNAYGQISTQGVRNREHKFYGE